MDKRLVLKSVAIDTSVGGAMATVELTLDKRAAVGHAGSSTVPDNQLSLVGEATLKAATEFLPSGIGLTLERVVPAQDVVYAKVQFRTPQETRPLWGIASIDSDTAGAVAKAVLSAINRPTSLALAG